MGKVLVGNGVTSLPELSQLRVVVPNFPTASLPAVPILGEIAFDITLAKLVVWTGAGWETVTSV